MGGKQKWKNKMKTDGVMSPIYRSWYAMIHRCTKSEEPRRQKYYRNVTVCDRWLNSFDAFVEDMGPRPEGMTLDRWPNNEGNYEPDNCRWATPKQQSNNSRGNRILNIGDFTGNVAEWCEGLKVDRNMVDLRLLRGWTPYEALFTPSKGRGSGKLTRAVEPR
jgi:hypothetical protein